LLLGVFLLFDVGAHAQTATTISGVVSDTNGPLAGATVIVNGTNNVAITGANGDFSLPNVASNAVFTVSLIGYTSQEVSVNGRVNFPITLAQDTKTLDEVIVVGYGTQRKVNLTGAIGQIDSKALEERPITNITSALQGTIPNLQITNLSGKPGESASMNIRGTTSINGGSPLVLVDGVEMKLDMVNPKDIANVTVLKDAAAAAIYGTRAAFGVILVTTKSTGASGDGKTRISYSGNVSLAKPTVTPEFVGTSWEHAEFINRACFNGAKELLFRQDVIDKMKAYAADPANNPQYAVVSGSLEFYGYSDLASQMVRDFTTSHNHSLNISGGSEKTKFYASMGYLNQGGLYKVGDDKFHRINTRLSVDNQTFKWLKLGGKILYNHSYRDEPFTYDSKDVWKRVIYSSPADFVQPWVKDSRYPELDRFDGMYIQDNSFAMLSQGGRNKTSVHDVWLSPSADIKVMDGWNAHVDFNYNINQENASEHSKPINFFTNSFMDTQGRTSNGYMKKTNRVKNYYSFNAYTDYENTFGKHYIKGMIGFNQELNKYYTPNGSRYGLLNDLLPVLNLGIGNQIVGETGYEWALRGGFFRANYIYDNRYLLEVNGRYDGSSRFPKDSRFVFLPSVSAGWRVSEEKFMEGTHNWLDNLKLRASYGELGNQTITDNTNFKDNKKYYPYIPFMSSGNSGYWIFGNEKATLINSGNLVSPDLTWEKASTINFGVDVTALRQRLDFAFDYYVRTTTDMIMTRSFPDVIGADSPPENAASLKTRGWELSVSWRDRIGKDWSYNIGFILSDSQAEITKFINPTGNIDTWYVGKKVGDLWGYETAGLFQSAEEVASAPSQLDVKNVSWGAGDVRFADLDGNNKITPGKRTLDDHGDLKIIGNETPRYQYAINLGVEYKNVYLRAFLQGVGRQVFYPEDESFWPAGTQYYNTQKWHLTDSWTPENPDAYFPIPRAADDRYRTSKQSRYLQNAAYLRMKNLTIGWNLPKRWLEQVGMSDASVYASGENLFEFSKIKGPYDPESARRKGVMIYPFMRTYSFGINVTF
jgi:TonB-linked SusC/RagA family outer membrane protein